MKEEFSFIPDFPGYYISRTGRVISVKSGSPVELRSRISNSGYLSVTVTDFAGNRTSIGIHRLLALAWKPIYSYYQTEVNHIDGNKLNNNLDNLEWCSHSENEQHKVNNFMTSRARRVKLVNVETKCETIFPSTRSVSRFFGVTESVISERLREYNHGEYRGYILEYMD